MAVYTDVSFEELELFLSDYQIGEPQVFKGIAEGVENSNYYLHTDNGVFILTLYEKRVHHEDLPFFLGLMQHLAARGLNCPTPVPSRSGALSGTLNGRPAAILSFLQGISLRSPNVNHCTEAGRALARLHAAGSGFVLQRRNALDRDGWKKLVAACAPHADSLAGGLRTLIESEMDDQEKWEPCGLPRGIIHADLFPDNVLFIENKVSGIIDFYFACNDSLAYDVAIMLNAWCFEPDGAFNLTKGKGLLSGYQSVRPLTTEEQAAMPMLARGAALRFLLTRLYDWMNHDPDALVRRKDPREFARRLRFHRAVRSPGAYGL